MVIEAKTPQPLKCQGKSRPIMLAVIVLTFSMKGFLQKMAYTMQSIIMYAAFSMTGYDGSAAVQTAEANNAISFLMFIVPPVMIIVSLIVFLKKYRIHGEFKAEVLKAVGGEK